MDYKITGYEPEALFHFFEEISAIPRGSSNEKAVSDYLVDFAKARGLDVYQDELWNVVIRKPASAGAENEPPVMLQGHLDMVCEKRADVRHDFTKDGIDLVVSEGVLSTRGTTLGGDNGAAVASMLAVLDDKALRHPPLECVFTTQEETGLGGAAALDKSRLAARTMINLDSEDEGVATVSCAGGMRLTLSRPAPKRAAAGTVLRLAVSGLLGGHSGIDIDKERVNANILMARLLHRLLRETRGALAAFEGGSKDNAIPRECTAALVYADAADAARAAAISREMAGAFSEEICPTEPDFTLTAETAPGAADVLAAPDARALVEAVLLAPNGVRARNRKQDGFVVASLNLGVVSTAGDAARLVFAPRSSVKSLQDDTVTRLTLLGDTFGFAREITGAYPGWRFAEESPIREVFRESYRSLFGGELRIEAIHAGLECGLFSDALPGLDAIAVGPTIEGVHTPDERLPLASFSRFYRLLCDVLARLASRG